MGDRTGIEWTDSTWNPTTGCTKVSAGCDNCYAETLAHRMLRNTYTRRLPVVDTVENREDPFAVRLWPNRLDQPKGWTDSRMIFVNSMSDLFHKDIPEIFLRRTFEVMLSVDWHVYQVLTKRPARAAAFVNDKAQDLLPDGLPPHIWIGTSVEDQSADYRLRHLLDVRAQIRFLSCEPLIGPLHLEKSELKEGIQWVIVGGESGRNRRPMHADWVRSIRDVCQSTGIAFFFKQWGGYTPKAGGRELDQRKWSELPSLPEVPARQALVS